MTSEPCCESSARFSGLIDAPRLVVPSNEDGTRPEEILESDRWLEGYEQIAETIASLPKTRCVYVADHEADIVKKL